VPTPSAPVLKTDNLINAIQISGNYYIAPAIIYSQILFQPGDELNPYKINRMVNSLSSLGLFSDVETAVENTGNGKKLIVIIKENPLVDDVIITGNTIFTAQQLQSKLQIKKGDVLNLNFIRKDIASLEDSYKEKGYKWVKINKVDVPQQGKYTLIYNVAEGVLNDVIISGNSKTKDYVILREMDLKPGKPLEENILKEDIRRIYNLNYFSELIPDFQPLEHNKYNLTLGVQEKPSGSFNFGAGYGESSGVFGFADLYLDNLFGTGQLVGLKGQIGQKNNAYELKYFNPWMFGDRRSLGINLWKRTGQLSSFLGSSEVVYQLRDEQRTGASFTMGWPYSYDLTTAHTFKYEEVVPSNSSSLKPYRITSYLFNVAYDTRDFRANPTRGEYYSFSVEKGFKIFANSTDFWEYDLSLRKFIPTFEKQVIAGRIDLGYMNGDINDKNSYIVGGASTVRGYSENTPFGIGNKKVVLNLEYRFLINEMFTTLLFVDTGWATNYNDLFDLNKYKIGKGVGLRLNTPLGPFRLDLGFGEQGVSQIHFNIGNVF
jgi:outer membrane protein insertion porin family